MKNFFSTIYLQTRFYKNTFFVIFLLSMGPGTAIARSLLGDSEILQTTLGDMQGKIEVKALSDNINSPYHDFSPTVSGDNRILIFNSNRPGGRGQTDLYESRWDGEKWGQPRNITELNTPYIDETPHITADGKMLIFSSNRSGSIQGSSDLYISFREGRTWGQAQPISGGVNSIYSEKAPSLSPDGKYLLFTRYPKGHIRQAQIMLAMRQGKTLFSRAMSLDNPINIGFMESCPVFHPKNTGIFFSSYRNKQSWNIYWAPFEKAGVIKKVIQLPGPVNTASMEAFFSITADGKKIYFSRLIRPVAQDKYGHLPGKSNPKPHYDIYVVNFVDVMQQIKKKDRFVIRLYDKKTRKPIAGSIRAIAKQSYHKDNVSSMELPSQIGKQWQIQADKKGYMPFSKQIIQQNHELQIYLQPIQTGDSVVLPRIAFLADRADLSAGSKTTLDQVFEFLTKNPSMIIELSGHTDNMGNAQYNQNLSQKRAESVRNYLISRGIDPKRLIAKGYGETKPLHSNATAWGRSKNRRTELKILQR